MKSFLNKVVHGDALPVSLVNGKCTLEESLVKYPDSGLESGGT